MYTDRKMYYRSYTTSAWTAAGTNLMSTVKYAGFTEELPAPKLHKVEIPSGSDADITDSVGTLQFSNGKHVLTLLLVRSTEALRVSALNTLISTFHGKRIFYRLSWITGTGSTDSYFCGRCTLGVKHLTQTADLLTLTIDREPALRTPPSS